MLFLSTGIYHDDRVHIITLKIFTKGFYVFGFDLTPDREDDEEHKPAWSRKFAHRNAL